MFHPITSSLPLPSLFSCPMCYVPHPLVVEAAKKVDKYLDLHTEWHEEIDRGKMFGVLIAENEKGELGYLAAFSGNLDGTNRHEYFVPPVFDFQQPNGIYKTEEAEIMLLSKEIEQLERNLRSAIEKEAKTKETELRKRNKEIEQLDLKNKKAQRDALRKSGISAKEEAALIAESQFLKAEAKRINRHYQATIDQSTHERQKAQTELDQARAERAHRSRRLQRWLFSRFKVLNALGKLRSIGDIFLDTPSHIPPSGAGECCAPKLLEYAFAHKMKPIAMGEWWRGTSPSGEVRHEGLFYPACHSKCEPILNFMLQGLNVEPNKLDKKAKEELKIIFEDEYLIIVDKPSGLCSVPGNKTQDSALTRLQKLYPNGAEIKAAHRLDMDTSGLLVFARNYTVYRHLQAAFSHRKIKKTYEALLCGHIAQTEGEITLPLIADIADRPRQKVDFVSGKEAITKYNVVGYENGHTRVKFSPLTGRTHQLRVHASSPMGLDCPIVGDNLYGTLAERLMLHACHLSFIHPITLQQMEFASKAPF